MKPLQKLYELADMAKQLVVEGRPSAWRSQGMKGPISGRPMYNVYTDEEFGDVVASLSFSQDDPDWDREAHARYIAACNPAVVIALAEELKRLTSEPTGYIDPDTLKEYRGQRAGRSWSPKPKTGEYDQTLPIYLLPPVHHPVELTINPVNPLLSERHQTYAHGYKAGLEAAKDEIIKAGYPVNIKSESHS